MKCYYEATGEEVFKSLPVTFHIKDGLDDPEFHRFSEYYKKTEEEIRQSKKKKKDPQFIASELEESVAEPPSNLATLPAQNVHPLSESPLPSYHTGANYQSSPGGKKRRNIWIVKPGENTNRGTGIIVAKDYEEIKSLLVTATEKKKRTSIV